MQRLSIWINQQLDTGFMKFLLVSFLLGILVTASYFPVLQFDYGAHNDFATTQSPEVHRLSNGLLGHSEALGLLAAGRPLNAFLHNFQFSYINGYDDLWASRLFAVLMVVVSALFLYWFCAWSLKIRREQALTIALLLHLTPSYQLFVYWTSNLVPGIIASTIGLIGGVLFVLGYSDSNSVRRLLRFVSSAVLLFAGILIYPPNATLFVVPVVIAFVFVPKRDMVLVAKAGVMFVGVFFFSFVFIKFIYPIGIEALMPGMSGNWNRTNYQMEILPFSEFPERFLQFFNYVVPSMFSIGNGSVRARLGWLFIFGILFSIVYAVISKQRRAELSVWLVLALALVIAAGPVLVPQQWAIGIRNTAVLYALAILAVIYLLFSLKHSKVYAYGVAVSLCALSYFEANSAVFDAAYNAHLEKLYVDSWVANAFDANEQHVYAIPMSPPSAVISKVPHPIKGHPSEFGQMAGNHNWFMDGILNYPLKRYGVDPDTINIIIASALDEIPEGAKNILDMNAAKIFDDNPGVSVTASEVFAGYGPEGLLESVDPGWHVRNLPQHLNLVFERSSWINGLTMSPQSGHPERMPNHITVLYRDSRFSSKWSMAFEGEVKAMSVKKKDGWYALSFKESVLADEMKIVIKSSFNGGDLVTLRGLGFLREH